MGVSPVMQKDREVLIRSSRELKALKKNMMLLRCSLIRTQEGSRLMNLSLFCSNYQALYLLTGKEQAIRVVLKATLLRR